MSTINIIAGPLIGALIGYVTNYIAVKMLFRPLYPIKMGRFTLPFTPGIFPKRKEQLAKGLGKAVGNNLLTSEDIEKLFLSEELKGKIVGEVALLLDSDVSHSIRNILANYFPPEDYSRGRTQLVEMVCQRIVTGIARLDLGTIIADESQRAIKEKVQGTMLALMANDKLIASLAIPMGEKVEAYINENGMDIIKPIVSKEIQILEDQTIGDFVRELNIEEEQLLKMVEKIYTELIQNKVAGLIKQFDIPGVVEQKVNKMDVLEIERLVLSVMKKELNAVVNLGALIGLVIGTINIFL